eukprot:CAMPEP_0197386852 /NCGR_PEP_ID=MMETSP1165-20131217/141_1 /TAXON_ID=284809 /ORGANISM="Chrysocystis fragilis, Strain CCMP3189" /LENGTH=248 /DNA_ID=CAMNT_0042912117 /DNA_START=36 /DNA_END=781 /DNA_ORIENTATION=-
MTRGASWRWLGVVAGASALIAPSAQRSATLTRVQGIFDGVKDAFSQDVSILEDDRVTPFDRWLGIDVRSEESKKEQYAVPDDFVDSMDEANYVVAELPKPMGIVFEENDPSSGGVFVASLAESGAAAKEGTIQPGDQLVAVGATLAKGVDFDACLAAIQSNTDDKTKSSSSGAAPPASTARSAARRSGSTSSSPSIDSDFPLSLRDAARAVCAGDLRTTASSSSSSKAPLAGLRGERALAAPVGGQDW